MNNISKNSDGCGMASGCSNYESLKNRKNSPKNKNRSTSRRKDAQPIIGQLVLDLGDISAISLKDLGGYVIKPDEQGQLIVSEGGKTSREDEEARSKADEQRQPIVDYTKQKDDKKTEKEKKEEAEEAARKAQEAALQDFNDIMAGRDRIDPWGDIGYQV